MHFRTPLRWSFPWASRWVALLAALCGATAHGQWQPQGAAPAASGGAVAASPPVAEWVTRTPDFYSTSNSLVSRGASPSVPMMPPPTIAPPSLSGGGIVLAQATAPPVITAPPIAQGFGTNAPPVVTTTPPPAYAPPPAASGLLQAPGWGAATIVPSQYLKFVQNLRLRDTWLAGDSDPNQFGSNDTELAVTFAFPNFLFSQQPLLISPGFILSLWDPPALPATAPAAYGELPSQVYSAYVDFYWTPQMSQRLSAELDFRIGVYSDFQSVGSDAIRPQVYGALIYRTLNPALAIKGGATYINRADIQVLPVFGVIWTPDQFTCFDITFPNPKLSHYAWRWGNTDVWWYIAGEYGGGSWEINDAGDALVDINDLRAIAGLEWTGGWVSAKTFIEVGYVFNREVFFSAPPGYVLKLDDTIMVRGGIAF